MPIHKQRKTDEIPISIIGKERKRVDLHRVGNEYIKHSPRSTANSTVNRSKKVCNGKDKGGKLFLYLSVASSLLAGKLSSVLITLIPVHRYLPKLTLVGPSFEMICLESIKYRLS